MRCRQVRDLILTDFIDSRLSAENERELVSHLEQCPACYDYFQEVCCCVVDPFQNVDAIRPGSSFVKELEQKFYEEKRVLAKKRIGETVFEWIAEVLFPTPANAFVNAIFCSIVLIAWVVFTRQSDSAGGLLYQYVYDPVIPATEIFF